MSIDRIHEEAFAIEQVRFKKTDKRVNPKRVDPFLFLEGRGPILVSAPHSVRTFRDGAIKSSDENTGSLAFLLNRETGCHALTVTKLYGGDPNWDHPCIYKARLKDLIETHSIRFVIDLHGAKRERPFDVDLGTMHGRSLLGRTKIIEVLLSAFREEGITEITENNFPASSQQTVTKFCAEHLGIPAVQLEINHRYRVPNKNGKDYVRLFKAIATAINSGELQGALELGK